MEERYNKRKGRAHLGQARLTEELRLIRIEDAAWVVDELPVQANLRVELGHGLLERRQSFDSPAGQKCLGRGERRASIHVKGCLDRH